MACLDENWKARITQLLHWAVEEEKDDGDIHLSLSCYCEAIVMLHRKVSMVGEDEGMKAAAKETLQNWCRRALLLQTVIGEMGVRTSTHPLLKAIPSVSLEEGDGCTFTTSHVDPLLKDPNVNPTPHPVPTQDAAAFLDMPLPPSTPPSDPRPPPSAPNAANTDGDFANVFDTFLKKHSNDKEI